MKALSLESLALRIVQGNPCTCLKVVTLKIVCKDYSQSYEYEVSQNKEGENGKDDMEQEVGSVVD